MLYENIKDIKNGRVITKDSGISYAEYSRQKKDAEDDLKEAKKEGDSREVARLENLLKEIERDYNNTNDTCDGGEGSGIKGHITAKQLAAMKNRRSNSFNPATRRKMTIAQERKNETLKSGGVLPNEKDYIVGPVLRAVKAGKDPTKAFAESAENENYYGDKPDIVADRKRIAAYLKKAHGIDIDLEKVDKMI